MISLTLLEKTFCLEVESCIISYINRLVILTATWANHVLLFPPLNSRGRFLVHKSTEHIDYVDTVSIGKDLERRVVVYFKQEAVIQKEFIMSTTGKMRRKPDMQVYVPKHRRADNSSPDLNKTKAAENSKKTTQEGRTNNKNTSSKLKQTSIKKSKEKSQIITTEVHKDCGKSIDVYNDQKEVSATITNQKEDNTTQIHENETTKFDSHNVSALKHSSVDNNPLGIQSSIKMEPLSNETNPLHKQSLQVPSSSNSKSLSDESDPLQVQSSINIEPQSNESNPSHIQSTIRIKPLSDEIDPLQVQSSINIEPLSNESDRLHIQNSIRIEPLSDESDPLQVQSSINIKPLSNESNPSHIQSTIRIEPLSDEIDALQVQSSINIEPRSNDIDPLHIQSSIKIEPLSDETDPLQVKKVISTEPISDENDPDWKIGSSINIETLSKEASTISNDADLKELTETMLEQPLDVTTNSSSVKMNNDPTATVQSFSVTKQIISLEIFSNIMASTILIDSKFVVENHIRNTIKIKQAKVKITSPVLVQYSESLCSKIVYKSLQKIGFIHCVNRKRLSIVTNPPIYIQGMANNFVNNAIENAMEILKSVNIYERKISTNIPTSQASLDIFQSKDEQLYSSKNKKITNRKNIQDTNKIKSKETDIPSPITTKSLIQIDKITNKSNKDILFSPLEGGVSNCIDATMPSNNLNNLTTAVTCSSKDVTISKSTKSDSLKSEVYNAQLNSCSSSGKKKGGGKNSSTNLTLDETNNVKTELLTAKEDTIDIKTPSKKKKHTKVNNDLVAKQPSGDITETDSIEISSTQVDSLCAKRLTKTKRSKLKKDQLPNDLNDLEKHSIKDIEEERSNLEEASCTKTTSNTQKKSSKKNKNDTTFNQLPNELVELETHAVDSEEKPTGLEETKTSNGKKKSNKKTKNSTTSTQVTSSDSPKSKTKHKKVEKLKRKSKANEELDKSNYPEGSADVINSTTEETTDDWDANFTEDGECLNEEMMKELSHLTGIKDPVIEKATVIDYLDFTPKNIELDAGEFGHIVEIFDFSPVLKTQDIFNAIKSTGIKDYNITWVDDCHALAVFASQSAAHAAIKQYIPVLQMRQVINGTRQSRIKAREFKDSLLPYKRRPTTSAVVARNLVASSLGLRTNVSLEQRRKERDLLKEAKEKKKQKTQSKRDIWENPD